MQIITLAVLFFIAFMSYNIAKLLAIKADLQILTIRMLDKKFKANYDIDVEQKIADMVKEL